MATSVTQGLKDFAEKLLLEIGAEAVVGGRNRKPSDSDSVIKRKGVKDNATFRKLLTLVEKEYAPAVEKISEFLDYLYETADPRIRKSLKDIAEKAISAKVSSTTTHLNINEQMRRILAVPIVEHFAVSAGTTNEGKEWDSAKEALKSFCSKPLEEMTRDYEVFAAEPDSVLDKALLTRQWLIEVLAERNIKAKKAIDEAEAPGGFLFNLKNNNRR